MRGVRVNSNGTLAKGLAELNHHVRNEQKEVRDGVIGGGQELSNEDESRINNDEDAHGVRTNLVQQPAVVHQRSLQQPKGPVVWDRFLPFGTLKVLLVEFDDSTRHVVSALLRNCSYEVTAVSNGIEAWKILEDLTIHIDLVLTEVAMPYLSGVGLLSKIANHKTCKNIPVIMMSSNDSMGIVFKCLSKGAVDFLVKPIRKNELKNLWQHVWRKCHSSSGSASESGVRTQKSSKSKSVEGTGNNNVGSDEDDIASISLNERNGSDNGSGTQGSWTKRAVEVDSPQCISPWEELADAPDSTCAQVIQLRPETLGNNWVTTTTKKERQGNKELGDIAMGKDLGIGILGNSVLTEDQSKNISLAIVNEATKVDKDKMLLNGGTSNDKSMEKVADLIGVINGANQQIDGVTVDLPGDISKMDIKDEGMFGPKEMPSLELSLKRQRDVREAEETTHEQNVLRRSNSSAFSRYNTFSTANQTPTGNVGSCSPHDNSSEAEKAGNLGSNSNRTPNQRSNGSSSNNDMGSTTNNAFVKPACTDKPVPKSVINIQPGSAFQPVRNNHTASLQPVNLGKADAAAINTVLAQANGISSQVQVQHHHHHYHHHHHHVHNTQKQKKLPNNDDLALTALAGPSDALTTPLEGNAANFCLNGSASGNNNGSNGQNASSTDVYSEGTNIGFDNGLAGNCEAGDGGGSGSGSRSGVDQDRYAQRAAALNKFRQKRKERCFEKKVRYQSRKKLAEQRPRVRGQFVRQVVYDNKSKNTDS